MDSYSIKTREESLRELFKLQIIVGTVVTFMSVLIGATVVIVAYYMPEKRQGLLLMMVVPIFIIKGIHEIFCGWNDLRKMKVKT